MVNAKRILQSCMPPILWNAGKSVKRRLLRSVDHLEYAPDGWATPLGNRNEDYWLPFMEEGRHAYEQLVQVAESKSANRIPDDTDINHLAYGYVLGLVGRGKTVARVLDYGGNLGQYYWIGRAMMPNLSFDFHCKELPPAAAIGQRLNPSVVWHVDDTCFKESYDLIVFSSSLQYVRDWKSTLQQAANSAAAYLFLSGVPSVRSAPTFMATQRSRRLTNLQYIVNCDELISYVEPSGLRLAAQFKMLDHTVIARAPEQPHYRGFLFERSPSQD